ncbi:MAG: alpha/beta hydrolase, partial [Actinomycetota bacterium]|nr:alpha/beta hydrolase [Actinomycetota bacterium]
MARVVALHGINNTYGGPSSMRAAWVPALLDGVDLAGYQGKLADRDIACVFYGDVFRRPGRLLGDEECSVLSAADVDGDEAVLLAAWWQEASQTDSAVVPPGRRTLGVVSGVQAALAGSKFLAGTAEQLLILWLKQVKAYFTRPGVREKIQHRFAEAIGCDTEVVVAHSLGSVVAYEALCAYPDWPVTRLVTLGSPLAIRNMIFDRLIPKPSQFDGRWRAAWPEGVGAWVNIADRIDFVALVKTLAPAFGESIVDVEIDNGARLH